MKRMLDLTLLALAVPFLLPATLLLALAVLVVDGRPVLFLQERVGRGRRPFRIWKLRTMTTETDPRARRATRLGAWLRARGLDELPQLGNVLLGEMSLVGPRPLTLSDAERLSRQHAAFEERFAAAPGLTGLAQVCLVEGAAITAELEAFYARNRCARMDLWILFRTFGMNVLGKRRAAVRMLE